MFANGRRNEKGREGGKVRRKKIFLPSHLLLPQPFVILVPVLTSPPQFASPLWEVSVWCELGPARVMPKPPPGSSAWPAGTLPGTWTWACCLLPTQTPLRPGSQHRHPVRLSQDHGQGDPRVPQARVQCCMRKGLWDPVSVSRWPLSGRHLSHSSAAGGEGAL